MISKAASDVASSLRGSDLMKVRDFFSRVAAGVERTLTLRYGIVANGRDQEWQRVNSYIADVLKDMHVLYAKLARLQGDFIGAELSELEAISEDILDIGERMTQFMKAFHSGDAAMQKAKTFGGGESQPGFGGGTSPAPPVPSEPAERSDEDYEKEIRKEDDSEFSEFEPEEGEEGEEGEEAA